MDLYNYKNNKLESVQVESFKLEKDIQSLVENNLKTLFNLELSPPNILYIKNRIEITVSGVISDARQLTSRLSHLLPT